MRPRKIEIGTSGYTYKHWNKIYYPEDLPQSRWFEHYASSFPTVELNVTFYRLPEKKAFQSWYDRSPSNFSFFIKGSRFITHIKKLKDCEEALDRFFDRSLALKEKYAGVLWQLSPRFKINTERLKLFLTAIKKYPVKRHVFEFRDESWFTDEIAQLLKESNAVYCRADRRDYYERITIPDTADYIYIRRHGDEKLNSYPDEKIKADVREIRKWEKKKKHVFVYYNNDGQGAALTDSERLAALLKLSKPAPAVISVPKKSKKLKEASLARAA